MQYLEQKSNNARGSRYTSRFAQECGVDANWLQSGEGSMLPKNQAREPAAHYELERPTELAAAIRALRPELRRSVSQIVAALRDTARPRQYSLAPGEEEPATLRAKSRRMRTA